MGIDWDRYDWWQIILIIISAPFVILGPLLLIGMTHKYIERKKGHAAAEKAMGYFIWVMIIIIPVIGILFRW